MVPPPPVPRGVRGATSACLAPTLLALLSALPAAARSSDGPEADEAALEVGAIVLGVAGPGDVDRAARALAGVEGHALEACFEALVAERAWYAAEDRVERLPLDAAQVECLLRRFERAPPDEVRRLLFASDRPLVEDRQVALLRVLERVGDARDVRPLLLLLDAHLEHGSPYGDAGGALEAAVLAILKRDTAAANRLLETMADTHPGRWPYLASALAQAADETGGRSLALLLHSLPDLDSIVLSAMSRYGPERSRETQAQWAEASRWLLDSLDEACLREAAFALGRLHDTRSCARLIALLEHPDGTVRDAAFRSLRAISGLRLEAGDVRVWRALHAAEEEWWTNEFPRLRAVLEEGDGEELVAALRAMASARFYRHEVAEDLARTLGWLDEGAPLVCEVLGMLGSARAVPELEHALDDPDPAVREAARAALAAIDREARR